MRALYLLDGKKVLRRLGLSSFQAAATELRSRVPAAILEDSIIARLTALSAQLGIIPCWQGVLKFARPAPDNQGAWLQSQRIYAQWARASQGLQPYDADERKISSFPKAWEKVLQWCIDKGLVRVADLRADGTWAPPVALPTLLHEAFHKLCSLVQKKQSKDVAMPPGRTSIVALLRSAARQTPEQDSRTCPRASCGTSGPGSKFLVAQFSG